MVTSDIAICFDDKSLTCANKLGVATIICPLHLKHKAEALSENIIVLSGTPKDVYRDTIDTFASSLSHVGLSNTTNDSYKFLINPTIEIFEILDSNKYSNVYCFGGNDWASLSIVLGDNVESSRALLTSKKYFINLMVSKWCTNNNTQLKWEKSSNYVVISRFAARCLILFLSTAAYTLIGKDTPDFIFRDKHEVAVYRKTIQHDILKDLFKKCNEEAVAKHSVSMISVIVPFFRRLLKLSYLGFLNIWRGLLTVYDRQQSDIKFNFKKYSYCLSAKASLLESNCLIDESYYSSIIEDMIKKYDIKQLYSCEMTSRFSFVERRVCDDLGVKSIGVQAGLVSSVVVPKFPVQNEFIAMSKSESMALNNLYSGENINYLGPIRKYVSNVQVATDLLVVSQPYAQDVIQTLLNLISDNYPSLSCTFRRHPRDTYKYSYSSSNILLDVNSDCFTSILESQIIIGMTTTVLEDAINIGKEVIVINIDEYTKSIISNTHEDKRIVCNSFDDVKHAINEILVM